MKDILKSKAIVFLFIVMLGFVYLKTPNNMSQLKEENNVKAEKESIVYKNN